MQHVLHQASVIFAAHCHHPALLGNLLVACPLYADVNYFLKITEGLPLLQKNKMYRSFNSKLNTPGGCSAMICMWKYCKENKKWIDFL